MGLGSSGLIPSSGFQWIFGDEDLGFRGWGLGFRE